MAMYETQGHCSHTGARQLQDISTRRSQVPVSFNNERRKPLLSYEAKSQIYRVRARTHHSFIGPKLSTTHLESFTFDMGLEINVGPIMVRGDADVSYVNQVLIAHRAKNIIYRKGPAHKVQLVVPSAPFPSPQCAVISTFRPPIRRLNASSNIHATYGRVKSRVNEASSEATKAEDAEIDHTGNQTSSQVEQGEESLPQSQVRVSGGEDRPKRSLLATDFDNVNGDNKDIGPIVVRTHRALCAADFEYSDEEDSIRGDDDIRGLDLEASARWSNCNNELRSSQECPLMTAQLRIKEEMLREIGQRARKARTNGEVDCSIFSKEAPAEEDRVLEMILDLMELGQTMVDAGGFQSEEGRDIEMMLRNNLHTLMRKATHPFRPSGIRAMEVEQSQCLEVFRQMRLRLLQGKHGMSMSEVLKERGLDLRRR